MDDNNNKQSLLFMNKYEQPAYAYWSTHTEIIMEIIIR